jgi:hypothetical protein
VLLRGCIGDALKYRTTRQFNYGDLKYNTTGQFKSRDACITLPIANNFINKIYCVLET